MAVPLAVAKSTSKLVVVSLAVRVKVSTFWNTGAAATPESPFSVESHPVREAAKELGYTHLYLESFPQLAKAVSVYKKAGFKDLDGPMGNSGHFAVTIWMVKELA